jgi:hypothetical protein
MNNKYSLAFGNSILEFEKDVNRMLEEGYKPIGSLVIRQKTNYPSNKEYSYIQPMYKETNEIKVTLPLNITN